jgi:two-component system, NarL family, nitrate/nitrite sensor histidine kinase NarX
MKPRAAFGSSLRARVTIGVVVPLIVVLSLAAYIQFVDQRQLMLENLERVSLSVGDGVEASLARAMLSRNNVELADVARNLGRGTTIRNLMILDMQGNVRIASHPTDVGTKLPLSDPTCQACHQTTIADSSHSFVLTTADGARVFRDVTPIRNQVACQVCHGSAGKANGVLVVDLPYDAVEANLWADLRQNVLLALAAIALVTAAINILLSRIVVSRLESFGEALLCFARGDYSARVHIPGGDEIGDLGRMVNVMAERLGEKGRLEEQVAHTAKELELKSARLETLCRVALESSRSLDVDRVIYVGLENALAVMEMQAGEIYLFDAPANSLRLRGTLGTHPSFALQEAVITKGECFCGRVAALDQASAIADLDRDNRVTRPMCRAHGYRAVAAVPLKARGRALGVLVLHSEPRRDVPLDEIALLSALGDQLGVAIDNALLYADMESRVQELSRKVQHLAVMEERVRLGREMHDGLAQALSLLNLKLRRAQSVHTGPVAIALSEMQEIVDATYEDVRQAIGDLRMPITPDAGIVGTLANYAEGFAIRYELQGQVMVGAGAADVRCSPDVQIQAIRIVQEALANVRRHAQATHLDIRFDCSDGILRIEIQDDGKGFDRHPAEAPQGHFGLSIMRERAASCLGDVQIRSDPGEGTTITLSVPVEAG